MKNLRFMISTDYASDSLPILNTFIYFLRFIYKFNKIFWKTNLCNFVSKEILKTTLYL